MKIGIKLYNRIRVEKYAYNHMKSVYCKLLILFLFFFFLFFSFSLSFSLQSPLVYMEHVTVLKLARGDAKPITSHQKLKENAGKLLRDQGSIVFAVDGIEYIGCRFLVSLSSLIV